MSGFSRRAFVRSASVAAISAGAIGATLAAELAIKGDMLDAELFDLIARSDEARAAAGPVHAAHNEAEERYFALRREGFRGRDKEAEEAAGLPEAERAQHAAEDVCIAAENAIRDYEPRTWRGLIAKARSMDGWVVETIAADADALLRDILALAEEASS